MNKTKILEFLKNHIYLFTGIIIGIVIFGCIYGFSTLNVQYDEWILNGYIEDDIVQHYGGWLAFRNSDWTFPIGKTTALAYPDGLMISYTDSIPLMAIIFKIFRNVLPETFQFFGIYVLICFVLQAISAGLLISDFTDNKKNITLGTIILTLSPIMIERAFRHTALASHWFILFAFHLYFKSRKEYYSKFKWQFVLLNVLTILIHPYFTPMILAITCATVLETIIHKKNYVKSIIFLCINLLAIVLIGYIIGAVGGGTGFSGSQYGYYSMNMNALTNPISLGVSSWSSFLIEQPQLEGNYDGFNYLGLGSILLGLFIIVNFIMNNGIKEGTQKLKKYITRNIGLFLISIAFYLFAITNMVTFNDQLIFKFSLPSIILKVCSIFRSSARLFYPVFYLIYLAEIVVLIRTYKHSKVSILLLLVIVVQVMDLSPALTEKKEYFDEEISCTRFDEPIWEKIANNCTKAYVFPNETTFNRHLAVFLLKNGIISNIDTSARDRDGSKYKEEQEKIYNDLLNGKNPLDENTVFITDIQTEPGVYESLKGKLHPDVYLYESLQYKFYVSKKLLEE